MQDVDFSSLIFLESGGLLVKDGGTRQEIRRPLRTHDRASSAGTTTETRVDALLEAALINAKVTRVKDGNEAVALLESRARSTRSRATR